LVPTAVLRAKIASLGCTKTCPATPRAWNVLVDLATMLNVRQHAMQSLLDHTVGTVKYVNVTPVIIALEKPQTKQLVILVHTPKGKVQFHATNAYLACMKTTPVQRNVKIAALGNIKMQLGMIRVWIVALANT